MHRFVPIYASWNGARVTEIPVNHHPRRFGLVMPQWQDALDLCIEELAHGAEHA
jgi:hypothetical protein